MGNGKSVSKTMLLDELADSIQALEQPVKGTVCEAHTSLAKGVTTLLRIKRIEVENSNGAYGKNSIKIGTITVSGTLATVFVIVAVFILKLKGVL